ncbi:histidine kinase [Streptomyces sp. NPDC002138]|uniref:sensor histidine kinase n=1 Tax=Streptomyces sp. NPDC002138 TaxID=3154410 RepID=UPI00332D2E9A
MTSRDTGTPLWTREDGLVAIGAVAVDLVAYSMAGQSHGWPVTASGMLLLVLSAVPLLVRRRHPVAVFAAVMVIETALRLGLTVAPGLNTSLVVALFTVVRTGRPMASAAVTLSTVALALLGPVRGLSLGWAVLGYTTSALLVVATALLVNRWRRDVEANRRLLADRAVADERRRIARELHDIVAHHITVMQLMAGGARANLAHAPEAAREALITLEDSGRLALGEMRQLLDVLRADDTAHEPRRPGAPGAAPEPRSPMAAPEAPQPGADDLDRLVAESRQAGLPTELIVRGTPYPLAPTVGLTVFRLVQEGLTNARKHAGDARAWVCLAYHPDRITVEVRDDGAGGGSAGSGGAGSGGAAAAAPSGRSGRSARGYGLIGMRERVALQGGTLEVGALDGGGFRVAAELPVGAGAGAGGGGSVGVALDGGARASVREEARR